MQERKLLRAWEKSTSKISTVTKIGFSEQTNRHQTTVDESIAILFFYCSNDGKKFIANKQTNDMSTSISRLVMALFKA